MLYGVSVLTSFFSIKILREFTKLIIVFCRKTNAQINNYSTDSIINIMVLVTPGIILQIIKLCFLAFSETVLLNCVIL